MALFKRKKKKSSEVVSEPQALETSIPPVLPPSLPQKFQSLPKWRVPDDRLAKKCYLLYFNRGASDEALLPLIALFEKREQLHQTLAWLQGQINKLAQETQVHESALEEIRFEKHMKDMASEEDDLEERKPENLFQHDGFSYKLNRFQTLVLALIQLEKQQKEVALQGTELLNLLEESLALGPDLYSQELKKLIDDEKTAFSSITSNPSSEMNEITDYGKDDEQLAELLEAFSEEEKYPFVQHNGGDSLFHLD